MTMRLENVTWGRVLWVLSIAVLSGWIVARSPEFLEFRERGVYDVLQRYGRSAAPQHPLVLIEAGERTNQTISQRPWPRVFHARLLERLKPARLVLLNVPLTEEAGSEEDELLLEAVRENGNVLGSSYLASLPQGNVVKEPFPALREVIRRDGVFLPQADIGGIYRKALWGAETANGWSPSLEQATLEELAGHPFPLTGQGTRLEVRLPWKSLRLQRVEQGLLDFWIDQPRYQIPVYEYIDVLSGSVPDLAFMDAVVLVDIGQDGAGTSRTLPISGGLSVSRGEYFLRSLASLMGPFSIRCPMPAQNAVLTAFLVIFSAFLGFIHFKKSFVYLMLLFAAWIASVSILFLQGGRWLPLVGPLLFSGVAYLGSQAMSSWRLYHEWNVRSLSIKPLLALAQRADGDLDMGMNFDEYLRSLWNEIEETTGVILKSTRLNENFSLVQSYLLRAQKTAQQGQENFYIIKNASNASPRHRMLLPLPYWNDGSKKTQVREYVILAWDGNIRMETLTSLAALTLFAAVHFRALEEGRRRKEMLIKTIEAIMVAVEAKDQTTSEHSRRVAVLSKKLAQWMKLSPQEIDDVYFSAIIHDIGKLGISDNILKKPDRLTEDETAEMQRHPSIGEDIMRPVELPEYVLSGITQHHERYDGKGYPAGIKGDRMTAAGKIIKVADVFDALVNRRQYKEAWTQEQVRDFLLERRGTEFDPQVVDVFLKHLSQDSRDSPVLK